MQVQVDQKKFTEQIWQSLLKQNQVQKVLQAPFIKGIIKGDHYPQCFTRLSNQGLYYVQRSAQLWQQSIQKVPQQVQQFCKTESKRYTQRVKKFRTKIGLKQNSTEPNQATLSYIEDSRKFFDQKPINILLISYVCYKLWPWISQTIQQNVKQTNGVGKKWVQSNLGGSGAKRLEEQINKYEKQLPHAKQVFKTMLKHEIEFFGCFCQ